ncbi:MAG: Glyoxylase, beta-lactamase superfamily II [Chloroflexi bacterium]|jgi:hydroxyacylglutathione hydrolase|nr:MAG: Glyoxylase, beta-lactamase superfamily II [Chloroflexota bacterium]|tara:strand:+ start:407 stop:1087 length:681 start_codon:yes stop_codon:yes gene_type:complete
MDFANELMVKGLIVGVFQENCWIVGNKKTGEAICIDPGDEPNKILDLAKDMGVKIKFIANSHAHVDHIMGVSGIHEKTGADFLLNKNDLDLLQNGWKDSAKRLGIDFEQAPPDPTNYVSEGDNVEVSGLKLQVIETPGHTPGSVSYFCEEAGVLFSGDTLFKGSIGRTDFPGGNFNLEMNSICNKLLQLPEETVVLPGHMEETSIKFEKKFNPFVTEWMNQNGNNI